MKRELIERITHSLLYEGCILYPYRTSAIKNRLRFNYGVVYPPACVGEPSMMQTECIVVGSPDMRLSTEVRFLQILNPDMSEDPVERRIQAHGSLKFAFHPIAGNVEIDVSTCGPGVFRVRVRICNLSEIAGPELLQSLISTHTILVVDGGMFVSSLDPPEEVSHAVVACQNIGTWPVLIGESGDQDCMLSSPIILYDYPQLAPESPGDFFDATEIEELLALRVLTLTKNEKAEIRTGDRHAKEILDRVESLSPKDVINLHGAFRNKR
jgi:hypothetical protein